MSIHRRSQGLGALGITFLDHKSLSSSKFIMQGAHYNEAGLKLSTRLYLCRCSRNNNLGNVQGRHRSNPFSTILSVAALRSGTLEMSSQQRCLPGGRGVPLLRVSPWGHRQGKACGVSGRTEAASLSLGCGSQQAQVFTSVFVFGESHPFSWNLIMEDVS